MRGREIVLALVIIALGVLLTYEKSGRLDGWFQGWDGSLFDGGEGHVYEESREFPGPAPAELEVINAHGRVEVAAAATDRVTVVYRERVFSRSREEADRIAAALDLTAASTGRRLTLSTNRDDFERKRFSTSFTVSVPPGTAVILKNSYGLVRAEGTGAADIVNPHGDVVVRNISGPLTVSSSYADVTADGVAGGARVQAPHARADLKNIERDLVLDHSYGEVSLLRVGGRAVVNGSHSRITARGLPAGGELSTSYEPVRVEDAGPVRIVARHADLTAVGVRGTLDVENTYGRIRLVDVSGGLKIDGRNVAVEGVGLRSPDVFVKTTYEDVSLSGCPGRISVSLTHGRLSLEPDAALTGPVEVLGSYADVRLLWPAGYRAPFEARVRDGRIDWNLPEGPDSKTTNGVTELRAFTAETGKLPVKVETEHGDVRVDAAGRAAGLTSAAGR